MTGRSRRIPIRGNPCGACSRSRSPALRVGGPVAETPTAVLRVVRVVAAAASGIEPSSLFALPVERRIFSLEMFRNPLPLGTVPVPAPLDYALIVIRRSCRGTRAGKGSVGSHRCRGAAKRGGRRRFTNGSRVRTRSNTRNAGTRNPEQAPSRKPNPVVQRHELAQLLTYERGKIAIEHRLSAIARSVTDCLVAELAQVIRERTKNGVRGIHF